MRFALSWLRLRASLISVVLFAMGKLQRRAHPSERPQSTASPALCHHARRKLAILTCVVKAGGPADFYRCRP